MVEFLLNGFLNGLLVIVNILTYPLSVIIDSIFPSFNTYINNFNTMVSNYIMPNVSFFTNMLPPIFKTCLDTFLIFIIAYYTIYWSLLAIIWGYNVIQKIKFW